MPKVRRQGLPRAVFNHLVERMRQREIKREQLRELFTWLETEPEVPQGRWFKRFQEFTVCRQGELIMTFLRAEQAAIGEEVQ
jgi:hypothetical protein